MSDTSNLANNNIEPSMEDILSSIRQVIAEDLSQQEAEEAQTTAEIEPQTDSVTPEDVEVDTVAPTEVVDVQIAEPQVSAENHLDDILELDDLLGDINGTDGVLDDTMELIQLEGETEETQSPDLDDHGHDEPVLDEHELEFENLIVSAPETTDAEPAAESPLVESIGEHITDTDFDETLDLVMDADASDYTTETLTPSGAEPQEDQQKNLDQTAETIIAGDAQIESILDDILLNPPEGADSDALSETIDEALDEAVAVPVDEPVDEQIQANTHDDMDLVKSLLEDLMDEPISETVSASVETVVAEANFDIEDSFNVEDSFSEDDLLIPEPENSSIDTETQNSSEDFVETPVEESVEESVEASAAEEVEDIFDILSFETSTSLETPAPLETEPETEAENEPENEVENELAQLAREIAEIRGAPTENTTETDDVVELSTPDYVSKLAISASLIAGAATTEDEPQGIIAAAAESELESLQQLIAETDLEAPVVETAETPEAIKETQEETQEEIPTETPEEIEMITSPTQEPIKKEEAMAAPLKTDVLSDADTQQEVGNAFASLTTTVQEHALAEENGPPIGELVKEALRPMLQEWLDKNLKAMVQRAVTKEIKRISTGK